jgi:hypothetical protein
MHKLNFQLFSKVKFHFLRILEKKWVVCDLSLFMLKDCIKNIQKKIQEKKR